MQVLKTPSFRRLITWTWCRPGIHPLTQRKFASAIFYDIKKHIKGISSRYFWFICVSSSSSSQDKSWNVFLAFRYVTISLCGRFHSAEYWNTKATISLCGVLEYKSNNFTPRSIGIQKLQFHSEKFGIQKLQFLYA